MYSVLAMQGWCPWCQGMGWGGWMMGGAWMLILIVLVLALAWRSRGPSEGNVPPVGSDRAEGVLREQFGPG